MQTIVMVRGKWQRRALQVIQEANGALTTRQVRIRCGLTRTKDRTGSSMRNALRGMLKSGLISQPCSGLWAPIEQAIEYGPKFFQ